MMTQTFAAVAAVSLAACAASEPASAPASTPAAQGLAGYAQLVDGAGVATARAVLTEAGDGVDIALLVSSMPVGTYAFHVHATGTCSPPDFTSAGPHFNPTGERHGRHLGDLPNVSVGADGTGRVEARIEGTALQGGARPIIDGDGASVIIHAKPDDGVTDPTGNAGARLACGVIVTK